MLVQVSPGQQPPQSLTVHPVLVAESDGWEEQLERNESVSVTPWTSLSQSVRAQGLEIGQAVVACIMKSDQF